MKVLIISIDKGLLGRDELGDVMARHAQYGQFVEKIDIIVFSPKGYSSNQIAENVKAYPTNSDNKMEYFFDAYKIGKKLFQTNNYDLIITQDPFVTGIVGWRLKRKFKSKLLVHLHGDFWQNQNWLSERKLNYLLNFFQKFIIKKADGIRVMSLGQKEKLIDSEVIDEKKVRVISTPVNLEKFKSTENFNQSKDKKIILHVGRDDEVKDFTTLLKAFQNIKKVSTMPVKLIQIGAGKIFQSAITEIGSNQDIEAKGKLNQSEIIDYYFQCDILVLSSTSESFGKVLVEANACQKPVVSTATTGAKEIIQDGYNGFLVPIGDANDLADKIIFLLNNPDQAQLMGENGKKLVTEKFNGKINTENIIKFWQDIVNQNL